ncbi:MAG TPA: metal-sulfur cluster assembly factor [Mycobacteriales bacterium]
MADHFSSGQGTLSLADWCAPGLTTDLVRAALREVIDPELGVNIVDLGLVYDLAVDPVGNITIHMTLTTPGCPLGGYLDDEIRSCLRQFPAAGDVTVRLVWDPPWSTDLMNDAARTQLGWRP